MTRDFMKPDFGKIGFIGLGAMGKPMAKNMAAAGYSLLLFDTNEAVYEEFDDKANTEQAASLEEFRQCAAVILMVPNSKVVGRLVLDKPQGLINCMQKGSTIIDMTSSIPSSTRQMGAVLAEKGINMIDAPVSGGALGATNATLAIMVGGQRELYEYFKPLLEVMGKQVDYIGELGSGHAVKAINNLLSSTTFIATAEALLLGKKMGLSPQVMIDVFNGSTSRSYTTEIKYPRYVLPRLFNSNATTETYYKDIRNALDCAAEYDVPQFLGSINEQVWRNAMSKGLAKEDYTVIVKLMEEAAGVELTEEQRAK